MEVNRDQRIVLPKGISRPGDSEVRRRERTYQDQSVDDEVDAVISGSGRKGNTKWTGMDEDDSGGWTGEWVEQHKAGSGIKDLDIKGRYSFISGIDADAQKRMQPSQIPPDDIQVRIIKILFLLFWHSPLGLGIISQCAI